MTLFFQTYATYPRTRKPTKAKQKTPDDMILPQIKDQERILDGERVLTADGKNEKKSWWNKETGVVDARIGVQAINTSENEIRCQTEEEFRNILEVLKKWKDYPDLKERIMEIHETSTKPKKSKAKAQ